MDSTCTDSIALPAAKLSEKGDRDAVPGQDDLLFAGPSQAADQTIPQNGAFGTQVAYGEKLYSKIHRSE